LASSCAVADVRGGSGETATATIWSATQGVYPQRDSVALVLGIPKANVHVIFVEGSGCYGLNGNDSVSFDAALLSQAVAQPVRVQYSRKDEMAAGESYGPAYVVNLSAGVDRSGQITVWTREAWTLTKGDRPNATTPGNIISGALAGFPTPPLVRRGDAALVFRANETAAAYLAQLQQRPGHRDRGKPESAHSMIASLFTGPLALDRLQNTFAANRRRSGGNDSRSGSISAAPKRSSIDRCLERAAVRTGIRVHLQSGNADGRVTGVGFLCCTKEITDTRHGRGVSVDQASGVITVTRIVTSQDSGPFRTPTVYGIRWKEAPFRA
jgi:CO/xanthine dehydrogenase Mo-binding subunit